MSIAEDKERYEAALHAVQTGVAWDMSQGAKDTDPKHLRVGVNSALVAGEAVATLLIAKGVFTLEEYVKAQADAMENEQARFQERMPEGVKLA